jgi:hypothetical protein
VPSWWGTGCREGCWALARDAPLPNPPPRDRGEGQDKEAIAALIPPLRIRCAGKG